MDAYSWTGPDIGHIWVKVWAPSYTGLFVVTVP